MDGQNNNIKIFNPIYVHPEEEPVIEELNANTNNILKDITAIDNSLIEAGNSIKSLLDNTKLKLSNIKEYLSAEKERQEDMNILCNRYTDFASVKSIGAARLSGSLAIENEVISATPTASNKCDISIIDVVGNGYEGNAYVYANTEFINKTIDSSNRKALTDNNLATYYEYSRITVSNTIENAPTAFNKDSTEASCSIELSSSTNINKLLITSERDDIILNKIYTSQDGLTYTLDSEYNIAMNERYERYNNQAYIYGSGVIAINPAKYVKIFFKSNGYTSDTIAYIDTFYNAAGDSNSIIKKVETVNEAKRHVIKISEISAYSNKYSKGMLISDELITDPISTMALYCNEYINGDHDISNNVKYFLIINGEEYEVQPINSNRNGKKIIRMSAQNYKSDHIIYLNETIKSAKLKIVIDPTNQDITPYISDVKILYGGKDNE